QIKIHCVNTYDRKDMEGFHYLSDSCMVWKEGCPSIFFQQQKALRLQLLIHPEWWTPDPLSLREKWLRMLQNNFEVMEESLSSRESSYHQRHHIDFHPNETSTSS